MTRDTDTDESARDRPADASGDHTFETDAVFDPETYLPTVEATLGEAATERDVDFLADHFADGAELLDAPCGHGRHANRLAEQGYRVRGLDRSEPFLRRAREDARDRGVAERVDYRQGDLRSLPDDDDAVDGVYNLFTSFGFFDEAGDRRVLREFARVLRPGGRLVMELAHRDGLLYDYRPATVARTDAGTVVEERSFDPLTGRNRSERLTVLAPDHGASDDSARDDGPRSPGPRGPRGHTDGGRRSGDTDGDDPDRRRVQEATYEVRLYSFTELRWLLTEAGFEVTAAYGGTDGSDLTLETTRMAVVAEA